MKTLIKGGRVIDPANAIDKIADVLVEDGKIAAALLHRLAGPGRKVGVVAALSAKGAVILSGQAKVRQMALDGLLQLVAAVVGGQGNGLLVFGFAHNTFPHSVLLRAASRAA